MRHPVLQAGSYARIEANNWRAGRRAEAAGGAERLADFARRHELAWDDADADRCGFLSACVQLADRVPMVLCSGVPLYRTEDLTTDVDAVQALLAQLGGGRLALDRDLVRQLQQVPSNRHRPAGASRDPAAAFAGFSAWQQRAFEACLSPFARVCYASLGYQLPGSPSLPGHRRAPQPPLRHATAAAIAAELAAAGAAHRFLLWATGDCGADCLAALQARGLRPTVVHENALPGLQLGFPLLQPAAATAAELRSLPVVIAADHWPAIAERMAGLGWPDGPVCVAAAEAPAAAGAAAVSAPGQGSGAAIAGREAYFAGSRPVPT